ncbi:MAG TPA: GNAT family N-acetyltransferase [Gaiellales bacterium]|nr:GNAT family N-acetyltransferase [Gaiellales bacterium]
MHAPDSPIVDVPVARDVDDVMELVLERLGASDDWDVFLMPGLPTHSPLWKAFESNAAARFAWRIAHRSRRPYVTLSDKDPSLQDALATLRGAVAPTLTRCRDALQIEEYREIDPRGDLFEEVMSVVRDRPQGRATAAAPTAEEVRRFFRELTTRAIARDWLSLWVLRLDGRVVETEYQLTSHGDVHALRRDADQSPAGLRLSDVLMLRVLETLVERPTARTYYKAPLDMHQVGTTPFDAHETLFVELFAQRSYQHLFHRIESRVTSLARLLRGESRRPCA